MKLVHYEGMNKNQIILYWSDSSVAFILAVTGHYAFLDVSAEDGLSCVWPRIELKPHEKCAV